MSQSLDAVISELAEVTDALIEIEADDFAGRLELMAQRNRLRTEARHLARDSEHHRPTQDTLLELASARQRRDSLLRHRSLVMGPQGHGVSAKMVELSSMADRPSGLEALTIRVEALESILTKRGIDFDGALHDQHHG